MLKFLKINKDGGILKSYTDRVKIFGDSHMPRDGLWLKM